MKRSTASSFDNVSNSIGFVFVAIAISTSSGDNSFFYAKKPSPSGIIPKENGLECAISTWDHSSQGSPKNERKKDVALR